MSGDPSPLRIGMLCPGYPSGRPGDYRGIFIQHLVQALKARGHRVCVLTSRLHPEDQACVQVDEAEEVHRFPFWSEGKPLIEYQRIPVARMITYLASALASGCRVFKRFQCDLIHSHFLLPTGLIGAAVARPLGRPHVVTIHGSDVRLATGKRFMPPLARWTLRHSLAITITAHHQVAPLFELGVTEDRLSKIPMGIHQAFIEGSAEPPAPAAKSIISTRTLRLKIYNISQLLRAMRIVVEKDPEITCTLAGEGPDRERLEQLARELGVEGHVTFSGWADPASLAGQLRAHRLYVSTSRSDGASISLFEAMASGVFPVVSNIPANREWIRDGENGRLFPLDDPEALAQIILEAMADEALIRQAIERNRQTALNTFTWEGVAGHVEAVYRQVLDGR